MDAPTRADICGNPELWPRRNRPGALSGVRAQRPRPLYHGRSPPSATEKAPHGELSPASLPTLALQGHGQAVPQRNDYWEEFFVCVEAAVEILNGAGLHIFGSGSHLAGPQRVVR